MGVGAVTTVGDGVEKELFQVVGVGVRRTVLGNEGEVADGGGGKASVLTITAGAMVTWMFGSGAGGD